MANSRRKYSDDERKERHLAASRKSYEKNRNDILMRTRMKSTGRHKKRYSNLEYRRQVKNWGVLKLYGITLEEYEQRLAAQSGLCALCGELMDGIGATGRAPVLDHCHETKRLRKFIHADCNTGIGKFGDDPIKLRKAVEYLEQHQ